MNHIDENAVKTREKRSFLRLLHESVILSFLLKLANRIYEGAFHSAIAGFLTAYEKNSMRAENSLTGAFMEKKQVNNKILMPVRRFFNRSFFQSPLLYWFRTAFRTLADCPINFYGTVFFSLGLYTTVFHLLVRYAFSGFEVYDNLYTGVITLIVAIPALFSQKPLTEALRESRLGHFIICTVLGIREETLIPLRKESPRPVIAFLMGLLLSAITIRAPLYWIPLGIAAVVGVAMTLQMPEIGLAVIFATLPMLPTMLLAGLLILTFIGYFCKLLQGKRTLKTEPLDIAVFGLMLLYLLGGIVSVSPSDSIRPALMYVCLMAGYLLTVNLVNSSAWIKRYVGLLCLSLTAEGITGLWQNFTGEASTVWQDTEMFADIPGRVTGTFGNPNVFGEFLIMAIPLLIAIFAIASTVWKKSGVTVPILLCCGSLIVTWSRGAWLGFMCCILLLLLIYWRQTLVVLLFGVMSLPLAVFFIPSSILNRLTSIGNLADTSTSYRVNIWKGCLAMLKDFFVGGIGTGTYAFRLVYPSYSLHGIESAAHSHNLYLELLLELGIPGFVMFAAVIILFTQEFFSYLARKTTHDELPLKTYAAAGFCGILAVLLQGMTDYVWYNYRIFCLFWLLIALVSACRRVGNAERITVIPEPPHMVLPASDEINL